MNTGGSGGKTPTPTCGDGLIEGAETCDDGNTSNGDGCDETCKEEPGYDCTGEPSVCKEIEPVSYSKGPGINAVLKYGKYNGTLESMECVSILVPDTGHDNLQWLTVKLGIDHGYIGELVIKVRSPSMTVSTLMSIPGYAEPKDDGVLPATGDSSNLDKDYPILFDDSAPNDAEDMGGGLWPWGEVCKDDNKCAWAPNPGSGPGAGLSDFIGEKPDGAWRVCVGDALFDYFGSIDSVELTMLAWK